MYSLFVAFTLQTFHAATPASEPVIQDVTFTVKCDRTAQHYVLMFPPGFDPKAPQDMIVSLHGHGSDRWQPIKAEKPHWAGMKDAILEQGHLLVAPDYRASTSWMGPKAEADVLQIIDEVKKKYPIRRTFLCGSSMGGSSVLTFTALHPELVSGVASIIGTSNHLEFENFQDAISESFGGTKAEIPMEYKNRSAEYWPERFTMPVAIVASGKDTSVPPQSVLRFADVLKKMGRKVLVIYREDTGHAASYEDAKAAVEYVIENAK